MDSFNEKFEIFASSCHNDMFRYCLVLTGNEFDADDVLNEALTRLWNVWQERADLPDKYNRGWLFSAIQYIVKEQRRKRRRTVLCGDEALSLLKSDDEIGKYEEDEQFDEYLREIRSELSEHEVEIFNMFFIDKCSYEDMSEKTGIKSSTLRSQISRLRKRLKIKVDKLIKK